MKAPSFALTKRNQEVAMCVINTMQPSTNEGHAMTSAHAWQKVRVLRSTTPCVLLRFLRRRAHVIIPPPASGLEGGTVRAGLVAETLYTPTSLILQPGDESAVQIDMEYSW